MSYSDVVTKEIEKINALKESVENLYIVIGGLHKEIARLKGIKEPWVQLYKGHSIKTWYEKYTQQKIELQNLKNANKNQYDHIINLNNLLGAIEVEYYSDYLDNK